MTISPNYAIHPDHYNQLSTAELRKAFHLPHLFVADEVNATYSHYDRFIVGGALPQSKNLLLENDSSLKAEFFLQRREIGIINTGATGSLSVDGVTYTLQNKEALYIGRGAREVVFLAQAGAPPHFYFNSAPAHATYPTRKVSLAEADTVEVGSIATSNHRIIRKLLVNSVVESCQLQMGLTELQPGSVWNTMPPHTHDRRMEAYFYFDIPEGNAVCHFMGKPQETRHLWIQNMEAVLSPPWSIHSGAGTSNYSFIWGMAGENLDYGDMDVVKPIALQ